MSQFSIRFHALWCVEMMIRLYFHKFYDWDWDPKTSFPPHFLRLFFNLNIYKHTFFFSDYRWFEVVNDNFIKAFSTIFSFFFAFSVLHLIATRSLFFLNCIFTYIIFVFTCYFFFDNLIFRLRSFLLKVCEARKTFQQESHFLVWISKNSQHNFERSQKWNKRFFQLFSFVVKAKRRKIIKKDWFEKREIN